MISKKLPVLILVLLSIFTLAASVFAVSEKEMEFLRMYFTDEELEVVSATRSLKSISRVAENVEVVTADDIELMNAHTLADVLNTVNGVVVFFSGASPGSIASPSIQGADPMSVIVFLDGVLINFLHSDQIDLTAIPAQIIERVEVIKGPASSAWGSSLGGVVNVITKGPYARKGGGMLSASYGEKNTGDFRAELAGKNDSLGYYLYAGRLQTDGLRRFEDIDNNNLYMKVNYDASQRTSLGLSFFYSKVDREEGDFSDSGFLPSDKTERLLAVMNLKSSLSDNLDLDISLRGQKKTFNFELTFPDLPATSSTRYSDEGFGASAKLDWKTGIHSVTAGMDYDYKRDTSEIYSGSKPKLNVFAVYASDTITLGKMTLTPGLRYDYTDRDIDFLSPSIGATYGLSDKTLIRLAVSHGFRLPAIGTLVDDPTSGFIANPDLDSEKIWSYQAGIETSTPDIFWIKFSAFRHDIRDAFVYLGDTLVNADKLRQQGFEVSLRTKRVYSFFLSAATSYVWTKNRSTGEDIHDSPDYTYDVGLNYDDGKSFAALLQGRYVGWHEDPGTAQKAGMLFDINMKKTLLKRENTACELFATGHNIFDASQYWNPFLKNARRWFEAGLRYRF
jgi:vitamin B12 transporter